MLVDLWRCLLGQSGSLLLWWRRLLGARGTVYFFACINHYGDRKESNGEGAGLKFMRREMKRKIFVYALIFYLVHLDTIEGRVGQVQCGNGSQLAARPVFMFHDLTLE